MPQWDAATEKLTYAIATVLDVQPTDQRLGRLVPDLLEVLPDWLSLYDLGPHFFGQGVMNFEDGAVWTWFFTPLKKRRRRG